MRQQQRQPIQEMSGKNYKDQDIHTWEMFETLPKNDEDCLSFMGDVEVEDGF